MKKNIIIICLLISMIVILTCYGFYRKDVVNPIIEAIVYEKSNVDIPTYKTVITNYNEYKYYFDSDELKESDFVNNNYVIIKLEYDPCADKDIKLIDYKIDNSIMNATIQYRSTCGLCATNYKYYLVKVDKRTSYMKVNIKYDVISSEPCDPTISYKPMIYIYPNEDKEVSIKLGKPELLTTTYPKYNNEWKVFAKTNGDLIINNKTYYGLYWEGLNNIDNNFKDGYIVYKDDLISFLEDKLNILGLNERESNEFIVYWLPILEQNDYNLIRFEDIDTINEQMPLDINPKPDTIIRVLMKFKPVTKDYEIKEQQLNKINRKGYTLVEWGGTQIKS